MLADLDDRVEIAGIEAAGDGGIIEARGTDADELALDSQEEAAAAAGVRSALLAGRYIHTRSFST